MLSESIVAYYDNLPPQTKHGFSVTSISPCPYATYLNYKGLDRESPSGLDRLRMLDGSYQEREVIDLLTTLGFKLKYTGNDQLTVTIFGSVRGRPDGLINTDKWDLLEVKAMSLNKFTSLSQKGLDAFPGFRTQVQLYMASEELRDSIKGCYLIGRHKDSARLQDVYEEQNLDYSIPIIEFTKKIVAGILVPEKPEPSYLCVPCRHKKFCQRGQAVDLSNIKVMDLPEVAEKWHEGKYYKEYGQYLIDEAREVFERELGEQDVLLCEDLKIHRIISERTEISTTKFVEVFGADRLPEVMVTKPVKQMRIIEV